MKFRRVPIEFTIPMIPRGWSRPRARGIMVRGKPKATLYQDVKDGTWIKQAAPFLRRMVPGPLPVRFADGPLEVRIEAIFPPPYREKRKGGPKSKPRARRWRAWSVFSDTPEKPDVDNVAKLVMDAMNGCIYLDDAQVARLIVEKKNAASDEEPHVNVFVRPMEDDDPNVRVTDL